MRGCVLGACQRVRHDRKTRRDLPARRSKRDHVRNKNKRVTRAQAGHRVSTTGGRRRRRRGRSGRSRRSGRSGLRSRRGTVECAPSTGATTVAGCTPRSRHRRALLLTPPPPRCLQMIVNAFVIATAGATAPGQCLCAYDFCDGSSRRRSVTQGYGEGAHGTHDSNRRLAGE